MLSCHGRSSVQQLSNNCSPINRRKQKHLHLGYMRDHMTGFSDSYQMAEASDSTLSDCISEEKQKDVS